MRALEVQSKGEFRVGVDFNPSHDVVVDKLKRQAADLIDTIEEIGVRFGGEEFVARHDGEVARLKSLAQTSIEDGAMWAVKAATKRPPAVVEVEDAAPVVQADEAA